MSLWLCVFVCESPCAHVYLHILDTYCKNIMLFEVSLYLCWVDCKVILRAKKRENVFHLCRSHTNAGRRGGCKHVCFCFCMFFCPSRWRPLSRLQIEKRAGGQVSARSSQSLILIISHPSIFLSVWESRIQSQARGQQIFAGGWQGRLRGWRSVRGGNITI